MAFITDMRIFMFKGRGKAGRGRHTTTNILQPKGLIPAGATLVPLVKQLVLPLSSLQTVMTI